MPSMPSPVHSGLAAALVTVFWALFAAPAPASEPDMLVPDPDTEWYQNIVPRGQIGGGYGHGAFLIAQQLTHPGVDIGGGCRLAVYAADDGEVVKIVQDGDPDYGVPGKRGVGNAVVIKHADAGGKPVYTAYLHMAKTPLVAMGPVKRGQKIGLTGATGFAKGCHLHFEVRHFAGIRGLYNPDWKNIYGTGDRRRDPVFLAGWSDPEGWMAGFGQLASVAASEPALANADTQNPSDIPPANACDAPAAFMSRDEILGVFAGADVDTREGAGRYVLRSYGAYDDNANRGELTTSTQYRGGIQSLDQRYSVRDGKLCSGPLDGSALTCETVKRCDPGNTGATYTLFDSSGQVSTRIGEIIKHAPKPAAPDKPLIANLADYLETGGSGALSTLRQGVRLAFTPSPASFLAGKVVMSNASVPTSAKQAVSNLNRKFSWQGWMNVTQGNNPIAKSIQLTCQFDPDDPGLQRATFSVVKARLLQYSGRTAVFACTTR